MSMGMWASYQRLASVKFEGRSVDTSTEAAERSRSRHNRTDLENSGRAFNPIKAGELPEVVDPGDTREDRTWSLDRREIILIVKETPKPNAVVIDSSDLTEIIDVESLGGNCSWEINGRESGRLRVVEKATATQ
jgi:hypothetical protein